MATDEPRSAADTELDAKLLLIRAELTAHDLAAVRLRGSDWFSWLTCGGSSVIDTSLETGVAELLITDSDVLVLADRVDTRRISDEEVMPALRVFELPWAAPKARDEAVHVLLGQGVAWPAIVPAPTSSYCPLGWPRRDCV
jgi:hypothetical protein